MLTSIRNVFSSWLAHADERRGGQAPAAGAPARAGLQPHTLQASRRGSRQFLQHHGWGTFRRQLRAYGHAPLASPAQHEKLRNALRELIGQWRPTEHELDMLTALLATRQRALSSNKRAGIAEIETELLRLRAASRPDQPGRLLPPPLPAPAMPGCPEDPALRRTPGLRAFEQRVRAAQGHDAMLIEQLPAAVRAGIVAARAQAGRPGDTPAITAYDFLRLPPGSRREMRRIAAFLGSAAPDDAAAAQPSLSDLAQDAWEEVIAGRLAAGADLFDHRLRMTDRALLERSSPGLLQVLRASHAPAARPPQPPQPPQHPGTATLGIDALYEAGLGEVAWSVLDARARRGEEGLGDRLSAAEMHDVQREFGAQLAALAGSTVERRLLLTDLDDESRAVIVAHRLCSGEARRGSEQLLNDADIACLHPSQRARHARLQTLMPFVPDELWADRPMQGSVYSLDEMREARRRWLAALEHLAPAGAGQQDGTSAAGNEVEHLPAHLRFVDVEVDQRRLRIRDEQGRAGGDCLFHALTDAPMSGSDILDLRHRIAQVRQCGRLEAAQAQGSVREVGNRQALLEAIAPSQDPESLRRLQRQLLPAGRRVSDAAFAAFQRCPHVYEGPDTVAQWTLLEENKDKAVLLLMHDMALLIRNGESLPLHAVNEASLLSFMAGRDNRVLRHRNQHWERVTGLSSRVLPGD